MSLITTFYDTENHVTRLLQEYVSSKDLVNLALNNRYLYQWYHKRKIPLQDCWVTLSQIYKAHYYSQQNKSKHVCYVALLNLEGNRLSKTALPNGLVGLKLNLKKNTSMLPTVRIFPSSLKTLEIGSNIEFPPHYMQWPPSLEHLIFNGTNIYNSQLPRDLPITLKTLSVNRNFYLFKDTFSSLVNLTSLRLCETRCDPNSVDLPPSLTELNCINVYNFPLKILPPSLTRLVLDQTYILGGVVLDETNLPLSLKHLGLTVRNGRVNGVYHRSTISIHHLIYLESISFDGCEAVTVTLPITSTLKKITFGSEDNISEGQLQQLPDLRYLDCENYVLSRLPVFPSSLRVLKLSSDITRPLPVLPPCLEYLSFCTFLSGIFNQPLKGVIPASLKVLILSNQYKQPLDLCHTRLIYLSTGHFFDCHILDNTCLPSTIKYCVVGRSYTYSCTTTVKMFPDLQYFGLGHGDRVLSLPLPRDPFETLILPTLYRD